MGSLSSIKRTMISKGNQNASQFVDPTQPPRRLPASNPALIGGGVLVGAGGLGLLGSRRLRRRNPVDPRAAFLRSKGRNTALVGAGLAAYGAYSRNGNAKNGYGP